eukprot:TRINITY_DN17219_c0_g1_i1.p1 TRINITY_DN17219_c0_g1~~TRINITY_DN17219_c0_g1_i1.p1  ORF type:complete len:1084 (-),score=132.54 TRINITY_DN17219_c0_g1_i1:296-3262(-)
MAMEDALLTVDETGVRCGVGAVRQPGGGWKPPVSLVPTCRQRARTNCTLSYKQVHCPAECPLVAPSQKFPCIFYCVKPDECSDFSPGRGLPDAKAKLCTKCELIGCKVCASSTRCQKCFDNFALKDGVCSLYLDENGASTITLYVLILLIVLLLATAFTYRCCLGSRSPYADENMLSILEARRHRHLMKVQNWDLTTEHHPRSFYDLFFNLHQKNILGVGLPLYYNNIALMLVVCSVSAGALFLLYRQPGLSDLLPLNEVDQGRAIARAFLASAAEPAILFSPMARCSRQAPKIIEDTMRTFAERSFYILAGLFCIVFILTLIHGYRQIKYSQWFDSVNADMSDFALLMTGVPENMTDEVQMKNWLSQRLADILPGGTSVHGVSIAYNYADIRQQVESMLLRLCKSREMKLDTHVSAEEGVPGTQAVETQLLEDLAGDQKTASDWFNSGRIRSTGRVFVVFSHSAARVKVFQAWQSKPDLLQHPDNKSVVPSLELVANEPVSIFWENQHVSQADINSNAACSILKVGFFFMAINVLVVMPYNYFVVWPFTLAGQNACGPFQTIAGMLLGIVNALIGALIYGGASSVGFRNKDRFDTFILVSNTGIQLVNTYVNFALCAWASSRTTSGSMNLLDQITDSDGHSLESVIVQSIYKMLVPGMLFVNYLMGLVLANMLPFVQHNLVSKIIYVWRALPDCLLYALKVILPWAPGDIDSYPRFNAEKALMAQEVPLGWDYFAFIVFPTTAFLMMACVSTFVWKTFMAMVVWSVFYYVWSRFMHLRVQSVSYYSTTLLDCTMWIMWALPTSALAASTFIWGLRSGILLPDYNPGMKLVALLCVSILAGLLWIVAYLVFVHPFRWRVAPESNNVTVDDVFRHKTYSWYNCNPVYVLKCAYFSKAVAGNPTICSEESADDVVPFQLGKQYLFMSKKKQEKIMQRLDDVLEFETYFELILAFLSALQDCACCCARRSQPNSRQYQRLILNVDDIYVSK